MEGEVGVRPVAPYTLEVKATGRDLWNAPVLYWWASAPLSNGRFDVLAGAYERGALGRKQGPGDDGEGGELLPAAHLGSERGAGYAQPHEAEPHEAEPPGIEGLMVVAQCRTRLGQLRRLRELRAREGFLPAAAVNPFAGYAEEVEVFGLPTATTLVGKLLAQRAKQAVALVAEMGSALAQELGHRWGYERTELTEAPPECESFERCQQLAADLAQPPNPLAELPELLERPTALPKTCLPLLYGGNVTVRQGRTF